MAEAGRRLRCVTRVVLAAGAALLLVVADAAAQDAVPPPPTESVPVHSTGSVKDASDFPLIAPSPTIGPGKPLLVQDPEAYRRAKEQFQQGLVIPDPAAELVEDTATADAP